jgi:hypothetical protein
VSPHTTTYLDTAAYLASAYSSYSSICVLRAVADDAGIYRTANVSAYYYTPHISSVRILILLILFRFFFFQAVADDAGLSDNESQAASRVGKAGGGWEGENGEEGGEGAGGGGGSRSGGGSVFGGKSQQGDARRRSRGRPMSASRPPDGREVAAGSLSRTRTSRKTARPRTAGRVFGWMSACMFVCTHTHTHTHTL